MEDSLGDLINVKLVIPDPAITFTPPNDGEQGSIEWKGGKFIFKGDADASAKIFLEFVNVNNETQLKKSNNKLTEAIELAKLLNQSAKGFSYGNGVKERIDALWARIVTPASKDSL